MVFFARDCTPVWLLLLHFFNLNFELNDVRWVSTVQSRLIEENFYSRRVEHASTCIILFHIVKRYFKLQLILMNEENPMSCQDQPTFRNFFFVCFVLKCYFRIATIDLFIGVEEWISMLGELVKLRFRH